VHRFTAALGIATMLVVAAACGDDGSVATTASTTLPPETTTLVTAATTTSSTRQPATTVARPATTRRAPTTTRAPATTPTAPSTTVGARTVALGETFTIQVGESVSVSGAGLMVTFVSVVEDSRCPAGVQCIQAGNGAISVSMAKAGGAPAGLTLNTTEGPRSATYGTNTVELVQLFRGPVARLRVA